MPQLKPFIIGIDAGVSTGFACWIRKSDRWVWGDFDFFSVQVHLDKCFQRDEVKIFVEHPLGGETLHKYARSLSGSTQNNYIGKAGGNRREAELLAESLRRAGWDVELVSPVREEKWGAEQFRLFTGSRNPASQHCRDAVRLAHVYRCKRELEQRIAKSGQ